MSRSAAATHLCLWGELFQRLTFRVRSPVMLLSASMQLVVRKLRFKNGSIPNRWRVSVSASVRT